MNRNYFFFGILLISFFSLQNEIRANSSNEQAVRSYIDTYSSLAVKEMERTGIPASIKLAQAINESGFGQSYLAKKGNNHFGIKCGSSWNGATLYKKDDRYRKGKLVKSCFRKYDSVQESYKAHSNFLQQRERYQSLFNLRNDDYKGWARGLQKAGYATSKTYAKRLIVLIEKYKLYNYDKVIKTPKLQQRELVSRKGKRTKIVNYAKTLKGKRYKYGGRSKSGFDCSGFTLYVMKKYGVKLNSSSRTQAKQGKKIKLKKAKPGDLVFFSHNGKTIGHVGMVVKNSHSGLQIIHATSSRGVVLDNISKSKYWKPRLVMARSVLD